MAFRDRTHLSHQESSASQIEGQTAYMLFYERDGIDIKAYLPKFREPSTSSAESANSDHNSNSAVTAGTVLTAGNPNSGKNSSSSTANGQAAVAKEDDQDEGNKKCRLM